MPHIKSSHGYNLIIFVFASSCAIAVVTNCTRGRAFCRAGVARQHWHI
jgi:hypothetical protein